MERGKNKEWLGYLLSEFAHFTLQNNHIYHEIIINMFFNLIKKVNDPTIYLWLNNAQLCGWTMHSLYSIEKMRENWKSR